MLCVKVNKNKEVKVTITETSGRERQALLIVKKSLASCPKTYKKLSVLYHNLGNAYNPASLTLYSAKDKSLRFEIFRDGNFFPYYGKFIWIN
jgi:hypothetical protein